tara:strand:- start:2093 stop:2566 length:474 start_codon:yes stop_codon:yes gene_type:complete
MARISTYALDTSISRNDLLVGTDAEDSNITKNFSVGALTDFAEEEILSSTTVLTPFLITATPGTTSTYSGAGSMIYATWSGGSGTHTLVLPSAVTYPYRTIRICNDATIVASDKIHVEGPGAETIDGDSFYNINKAYNGILCWSDGSNWIVIQAKSN